MRSLKISGATVFTGTGRVLRDCEVLIEQGRIRSLGSCAKAPKDVAKVDGGGLFLMAGFIDAHTHLAVVDVQERPGDHPQTPFMSARQARQKLASGVTTVRDLGGIHHYDIELKRAVERGDIPGPRMLSSGRFITPTGGHCHFHAIEADGPDAVRRAVRLQLKAGADVIKLMVSAGVHNPAEPPDRLYMHPDEIRAAVSEAHEAGRRVAAHVHPARGILTCIEAGVDTLEHATWLNEESVEAVLAKGIAIIPTQDVYRLLAEGRVPNFESLAGVARRILEEKTPRLRHAIEKGVRVGVGTDCCHHYPCGDFVSELQQMKLLGMTEEEVLSAATKTNAEILGLSDQLGTLEVGKVADIILLEGNPLEDLEQARKVRWIIQGGCLIDPRIISQVGQVV